MLIDYESIIILNESVCSDFIDGNIKFEIFQNTTPVAPKPNCFIQNLSVIQYINPMLGEEDGKLKFSVAYKKNELSSLKYAAVVFNKNISCTAEIRIKNEIATSQKTEFRIMKLVPLPESEKLELSFIPQTNDQNDILQQIRLLSENNITDNKEISELEQKLADEKSKSQKLCSQKLILNEKLASIKSEIENILSAKKELEDLQNRREAVRRNLDETSENIENAAQLSQQLSCYNDILIYYKDDEGYQTVSDRLNEIKKEISTIEQHISLFVQKRSDKINQITDQLNI